MGSRFWIARAQLPRELRLTFSLHCNSLICSQPANNFFSALFASLRFHCLSERRYGFPKHPRGPSATLPRFGCGLAALSSLRLCVFHWPRRGLCSWATKGRADKTQRREERRETEPQRTSAKIDWSNELPTGSLRYAAGLWLQTLGRFVMDGPGGWS